MRPILFFSYEGQVAVEGIVTTLLNSGPARQDTPGGFAHELCKLLTALFILSDTENQAKKCFS